MAKPQKQFDFRERRTTTVVSVCCMDCDTEASGKRLDLVTAGWSQLLRIYDEWAWFEFLGVCPQCKKQW
jgi:hypothetical protein